MHPGHIAWKRRCIANSQLRERVGSDHRQTWQTCAIHWTPHLFCATASKIKIANMKGNENCNQGQSMSQLQSWWTAMISVWKREEMRGACPWCHACGVPGFHSQAFASLSGTRKLSKIEAQQKLYSFESLTNLRLPASRHDSGGRFRQSMTLLTLAGMVTTTTMTTTTTTSY